MQKENDGNTMAWNVQVWASFLASTGLMLMGILVLDGNVWVKGYLLMGLMFTIGSCFSLAKNTRDNHEARRLRNRVQVAKNDKILREFEMNDAS